MAVTLQIQNDYSWLLTDNEQIKHELYLGLRKREKGYYHSTLYKRGIWDGYVNFFDKAGGRFLTGLLPEVLQSLKKNKIKAEIVDRRTFLKWQYKKIGPKFLHEWAPEGEKHDLRDYQVEAVNSVIRNYRGLVKYPTGAGKTQIMIGILKSLPKNTPTLFLTKGSSLVDQNYKDMIEWGVKNVGRVYGKHRSPNLITCANTNKHTLEKLKPLLPKFKALIVDEVHDCMSTIPKKAYQKMSNAVVRIGVSATPFKHAGSDVTQKFWTKGFFGPVLAAGEKAVTTKQLQDRNILSKSDSHFYLIDQPKIHHEPYLDAVTMGIAENFYFLDIVKRLALSLKGRSLILVDRITQGDMLHEMLPGSYWIKGLTQLEERGEIFNKLKYDDNATVIVMQQIVSAGINVFIHNLINAAGGKAEHSIIQRMGRGLRTAKDKVGLKYYDFIFDINEYLHKHSMKRIEIIKQEKHPVTIHNEFNF